MRVVLVGHGGREAALAWRIMQSEQLTSLVVTGENPGWPSGVEVCLAKSPEEIVAVAKRVRADLAVVGPEAPLAAGAADALMANGIACFGPSSEAARLESSKAFAKEIMEATGVQTAAALVVDRDDPVAVAAAHARCEQGMVVVKADGLAAGKGVFVCRTAEEAAEALQAVWSGRFGEASRSVVLEDLLEGPEVSLFAICDGERVVILPSAQDHKQLLDGGAGPNTGGMGAYAPCPLIDGPAGRALGEAIHLPVIRELARRGHPFRGLLYAGLMMTDAGPKVLEFNVRFGDPECQPLMVLWADDLLTWLHGAATGNLPGGQPQFSDGTACCVVLASAGYPLSSDKGQIIPEPEAVDRVHVFQSGTQRASDGTLRTNGGRVIGITGVGETAAQARARAYGALPGWTFPGAQFRTDIAAQADS
jgi:phosphoribosylamine---glycine ligase